MLREDAVESSSTTDAAKVDQEPAPARDAASKSKLKTRIDSKVRKSASSVPASAASAASSSAPRKVPQPKDWRAGPRRKKVTQKVAAKLKREPTAPMRGRAPRPTARKTTKKKAAVGKRKDRDDGGGASAASDRKLLGPAKRRSKMAGNANSNANAERRRSRSRNPPQQQARQQPVGATAAVTATTNTRTTASNGSGKEKIEESRRNWDGKPLKTLPFKPFIFSTKFVPPTPMTLVKGTSPFSKAHLHSSRRRKRSAAANAGKTTAKGGDGSNNAASLWEAKTASIIGPVPGTSGACMQLSILDSSAETIAKGYVPSTESCPPLRPPKGVPRLYAQNAQAPIAEEAVKLEKEAAKTKRKLKKANSASRGRSDEVLTIAPLVLRPPTYRGRPLQRVQTMMHRYIVGGDFEHAWRRIWSHSAELVVQDAEGMTPCDYAITFDAPQELLEAMLRAQLPLNTDVYTVQHPVFNKDDRTQTIKSVLHPETDKDTVSPYLYNDLGQMPIHRAFRNNYAVRNQKMLLHYNPEIAICELLTQGLIKRIDRERKTVGEGEYTTLTFWSRAAASAFVDRTDPRYWNANASSGPRCSRKHVRNAKEVTSNLFDLAWNCKLERAVTGRKVFLDEAINTAEKCNDVKNMVEGDRIAIGLMWSRFSLLLKTTYETYFGPNALYQNGELKTKTVVELFPELAPNVSVPSSRLASTPPEKRELAVQKKLNEEENGPAAKVANCTSSEAASISALEPSLKDETPQKMLKVDPDAEIESFERPEMPPPPHVSSGSSTVPEPVPLTHNPKLTEETVVAPSHPALVTALLYHDVALEVITFILRLFPEQCKTKDVRSGLYPIHVVAKGLCPPFRWGWKLPASKDNDSDENGAKTSKAKHAVRKERDRSTALIPLLLKACPESANLRDSTGRIPAHYALERGHRYLRDATKQHTARGYYDTGLKDLIDASPSVHVTPDPKTGLYPFMLAATSPNNAVADLTTVYELLRSSPDSVSSGITKRR